MKRYELLKFPQLGDERGNLIVIEELINIPFKLKRMFYIYGTEKNVVRGQHANRNSRFVMINLAGSCKVNVHDGINSEVILLDKPYEGLYLDNMTWKDMYDFSEDAILLVLSDCSYDALEYIKDIEQFKQEAKLFLKVKE